MSGELTFSGWLRQQRNDLGVTQDDLSERLGFSPAMMRKLESGERRPSGQIANLLADYFRIPSDEREAFVAFARSKQTLRSPSGTTPGDEAPSTPWRQLYLHQTNLPTLLTPFVGREHKNQQPMTICCNQTHVY